MARGSRGGGGSSASLEERLKQRLEEHLGLERIIIDSVVDAIDDAVDQREVEALVQNFIGEDEGALAIIQSYLAQKRAAGSTRQRPRPTPVQVSGASRGPSGARADTRFEDSAHGSGRADGPSASAGAGSSAPARFQQLSMAHPSGVVPENGPDENNPAPAPSTDAGPGPSSSQGAAANPTSMINVGRNIPVKQSKKMARAMTLADQAPEGTSVEKQVANCLSCGKVYDLRKPSEDALSLVRSGGTCVFCNAHVNLSMSSAPAPQRQAEGARAKPAAQEDADRKAAEFKNRLVAYDREGAKRTAVIDDQSDWFAIDSNAWLTDEEKEEARRREAAILAAEEAHRNRIQVRVDLVGRQVVVVDQAAEEDAARQAAQDAAQGRPRAGAFDSGAGPSSGAAGLAADVAGAAEATLAEAAHGGGTAGAAALQAAAEEARLRDLRLATCPDIKGPSPMFMPRAEVARTEGEDESPFDGMAALVEQLAPWRNEAGGVEGAAA
ncbi:unnamed protein product [Pedinophyceae sp. YPF-701]|nr:unnamed protein product [Pedinophyceae sp. YPF-701]